MTSMLKGPRLLLLLGVLVVSPTSAQPLFDTFDFQPGDIIRLYVGTEELLAQVDKHRRVSVAARVSDPDLGWKAELRNGREYISVFGPRAVLDIIRDGKTVSHQEGVWWPYPIRRDLPQ
jgi:hypothetical protein